MADEPQIPAAAEPAAAAEPTPTAPAQDPSLLETFVPEAPPAAEPVVEPVAVEPVADPKAEPAEASPAAAPEPVVYEAFTLPEGVAFDDARLDGFRELAGEARVPQEKAQGLLDMHTSAMREYADHMSQEQHRVFNETRRGWQSEVKADPEMGGSGFMTAMTAIAGVRDRFVPAEDLPAFNAMLTTTGAGDHPQFLRFIHKISKALAEPTPPPPDPRPTDNPTVRGRRATLYDNPRS